MWSFFSRDPVRDFGYEIGEYVEQMEGCCLWQLHRGTKKGTDQQVSVFVVRAAREGDTSVSLAKSALKRYKTLRHPSIIRYIDSLESDGAVFLVTEPVVPLDVWLSDDKQTKQQKQLIINWGLLHISKVLAFIGDTCHLSHNNVCMPAVYIDQSSEWKLAGLEFVSPVDSNPPKKMLSGLDVYKSPDEVGSADSRRDCWGLGCLIWESFNGPLADGFQLETMKKVDRSLHALCTRLLSKNLHQRPSLSSVVDDLSSSLSSSELHNILVSLDELQLKEAGYKERFVARLTPLLDQFPPDMCRNKILPQLLAVFEFGGCGVSILPPIFKLGCLLNEEEYQLRVVPCLLKLFSSTDRHTRVQLLQQMDSFVEHLQPHTVNDQVFPHLVGGFLDSSAVLREHTVRACVLLAPKLNFKNLNVELLKYLARLQAKDDEGGIRTNTTVCIAKLAEHLSPEVRQKVLKSAFIRALKDPFPPSRCAGIRGIASTLGFYTMSELAERILPSVCPLTADSELSVRQLSFSTINTILQRLQSVSEHPELRQSLEADVNKKSTGGASSWAGWAVDAITSVYNKRSSNKPEEKKEVDSEQTGKSEGVNEKEERDRGEQTGQSENDSCQFEVEKSCGQTDKLVSCGDGWDEEAWEDLNQEVIPLSSRVESITPRPEPSHASADEWRDFGQSAYNNGRPVKQAATRERLMTLQSRDGGASGLQQKRPARPGPMRLGAKKL